MSAAFEPDAAVPQTTPLHDEQVADYLQSDPGFFQRYPHLVGELALPHESGEAVSLVERQVAILRERNRQMRRRMNQLLQAARDNDALFAKTRNLTLELLGVETWQELNEALATCVLADFQADFVCCHLAGAPGDAGVPASLDHLSSHGGEQPHIALEIGDLPICATLRAHELARLFPHQEHDSDGSAVLAPIRFERAESSAGEGCLAIGSREAGRFTSDMDTLFVTYIGEVLSRVVQRLTS